jgi:hypothetical protein
VAGITCVEANNVTVLSTLSATMVTSLAVPSSWVTVSTNCASRRLFSATSLAATRALQTFTVVYTVTVSIPASAPTAQVQTLSTTVGTISALTPTQLGSLLSTTVAALIAAGAPAGTAPGAIVTTINGQTCTGTACSNLIIITATASSVDVGAVIGGVIGGFVALTIFIVAVLCVRRPRACCGARARKDEGIGYSFA